MQRLLRVWTGFRIPERMMSLFGHFRLAIRPSIDGRRTSVKLEVDFVANKDDRGYYIQFAYMIPDETVRGRETKVFSKIGDGFRKIVMTGDDIAPYVDENSVLNIGIRQFLLDKKALTSDRYFTYVSSLMQ